MLKTRILLIAAGLLMIWLLFLLPRVVVENEGSMQPMDQSNATADPHQGVPQEIAAAIKSLRLDYLKNPASDKSAIFADSLNTLYREAGQFDSAAWFAEKSAAFFNTMDSYQKAGNSYYDAFTFALDPEKQAQMAEKGRAYLLKVVVADPSNLDARNKIAMTYVSSSTPMEGIGMLREILKEEPENETALFNMGMLSIQSGQTDRAIEWLSQLTKVNERHIQGQLLLGVALLNKGDKEKAKKQFEKVKELDPDPSVQATADSYLKNLN